MLSSCSIPSFFFSPRAGGYYRLTGEWDSLSQRGVSLDLLAQGTPREKANLSNWIYQQNLEAGLLVDQPFETGKFRFAPTVDRETVLQSYNRQSPALEEQLLGFVRELMRQQEMNRPSRELAEAAAACFHDNDYVELVNRVQSMDWIQQTDATFDPHYTVLNWDARFWVEQQTRERKEGNQGFIARRLPSYKDEGFTEMKRVGQVIEATITDAGYTPYCVITDDSISEGIDDEIIAQIRQSRFLIADLTDEGDQGRRNVYYEAGVAYGLGLQVIYACQEKQFEEKGAAFDIQQRDILLWDADRMHFGNVSRTALRPG